MVKLIDNFVNYYYIKGIYTVQTGIMIKLYKALVKPPFAYCVKADKAYWYNSKDFIGQLKVQ